MSLTSPSVGSTLGLTRRHTVAGADVYDLFDWERRDARLHDWRDGSVAFEQTNIEVPASWSVNASNILAQKYFRGTLNTPERETSLRQVADRVVDTITQWGRVGDYFANEDEAAIFSDELKFLIVSQRMAFNSPVWFNIGVKGVPQQASACFILSVDDTMESILNWYAEEGMIFKGGSGAGVNLSKIRSSVEHLEGGGTASGPVSFMRGADASAGTIKSGGKTRRAAKMVMLDVSHPDVQEFVWCKAKEEQKARALRDAGFDMDLDGADSFSIQYQNANNSVRVTDEFMQAVEEGADWHLRSVLDGSIQKTMPARELLREIATAAWECADPGIQYDTTINRWHTTPNAGRINGSNPCFTGDSLVHTDRGLIRFDELTRRVQDGETFQVYTHDITNVDAPEKATLLTSPEAIMITGMNPIMRLEFANGMEVRCTPNHSLFTTNRGWVAAENLTETDEVATLDVESKTVAADYSLPVSTNASAYRLKGYSKGELVLPEKWTDEFAHYLGWIVGDGCITKNTISAIYGTQDEQDELMPLHQALMTEINNGVSPRPSTQENGTVQLRMTRGAFTRFVESLGVLPVRSAEKEVPWSIEQAPAEIAASFLRGLFDADGTVVFNESKGHYVGLGSTSKKLLRGAQRLLTQFGVSSRIYETCGAGDSGFHYVRQDGTTVGYGSSAMYDLRISSSSIDRFANHIGFGLSSKAGRLDEIFAARKKTPYNVKTSTRLVSREHQPAEVTYNLCEPRNHSYVVNGLVVKNCSEYMHIDNSACNLASLNLLAFHRPEETGRQFEIDEFISAVDIIVAAQEIIVGPADYPTEKIGENTRKFRQLGLGYANLGALLMAVGAPYDSDRGRAIAGAITALMGGSAYNMSTRLAEKVGPFDGYAADAENVQRVLGMHRGAVAHIDADLVPDELLDAANAAWDDTCVRAAKHGVRNAQATVLAPTGTISFMMDCDTTGIEPDLGLVKMKKLVGGGTMSIVNQGVGRALTQLGYDESAVTAIEAHISDTGSVLGAPGLADEHVAVFACSMGDNVIAPEGHIKMMAAVQPFLSGAISKTVNTPESTSIDEFEQIMIDGWKSGLKAVALYRDNCKVGQPLTAKSSETTDTPAGAADAVVAAQARVPEREKLPRSRASRTFEFRVADCKGFVTVGEYEDGRPGELFIRVSKQGSTLAGIMDAFAISVSHGLQYGVPLSAFVDAFVGMRFEPAGMTDDADLRLASSLMDYLFRRLAVEYMTLDERTSRNILTTGERSQPTLPGVVEATTPSVQGQDVIADPPKAATASPTPHAEHGSTAPFCGQCGTQMVRAGSCYACRDCGSSSGCS